MTGGLERGPDLALARMHLRLGSLALARAELETMAGRDSLDDDGLLDLTEVRWRTGDLVGAGEAADAILATGAAPLLALVIAAEAAASDGRLSDARRVAARALEAAGGAIDDVFAGMPRSTVWPPDPAAPPPSPATLFPTHGASPPTGAPEPPAAAVTDAPPAASGPPVAGDGLRLWDLPGEPTDETADLAAESELDAGREALARGDLAEAGVRLAIALRLAPAVAPVVLDLVADRRERALALVRGDAYRLVGRETEARRAFADAVRREPSPIRADPGSTGATPADDTPAEGDPA